LSSRYYIIIWYYYRFKKWRIWTVNFENFYIISLELIIINCAKIHLFYNLLVNVAH
jgi:hypothetical protein